MEKENIRFWVYWNRGFVKITVPKGKTIEMYKSEPDEEGYSYEHDVYTYHDNGTIEWNRESGGRDCDGMHSYYKDFYASEDSIQPWMKYYPKEIVPGVFRPDWKKESESVYDQYAQMMNY